MTQCIFTHEIKKKKQNRTNEDNVTPLHVAATEGQIDCLKALLELRADTQIKDVRGHTALDLAKIWGHRTCGK